MAYMVKKAKAYGGKESAAEERAEAKMVKKGPVKKVVVKKSGRGR